MKNGEGQITEGMELSNQERIRMLGEKKKLQALGNIRSGHHQTRGDESKIRKEYVRRIRKLFKTKLSSRNLIKKINTWAFPLVRFLGPFLKWTRTPTNGPEYKKVYNDAQDLTSER